MNRGRKHLWAAFLTLSVAAASSVTAGPLVGTIVNGKMAFQSGPGTVLDENVTVVDPGVEFTFLALNGILSADVSANFITLGLFTGTSTTLGDDVRWEFRLPSDVTMTGIGELSDNFPNGVQFIDFSSNMVSIEIPNQFYSMNQTFTATYGIDIDSGSLLGVDANGKLLFESLPNIVLDENVTVVDPGVEFTFVGFNNSFLRADLSDTLLTLQMFTGDNVTITGDTRWTFTLPRHLTFTGLGLLSENFPGVVGIADFSPNMISIDIGEQHFLMNQTFTATFGIELREVASIPQVETLTLLGIGLAVLVVSHQRSRKAG